MYGTGSSGNIYLDGQSFGETGSRAFDGSECVNYSIPSGTSAAVSDYEGWFYLAPTVYVSGVVIQGLENNSETTVSAVNVVVSSNNIITCLQADGTTSVSELQASITLSYSPVGATTISLIFTGTGVGSIVTIASSVTAAAGQQNVLHRLLFLPIPAWMGEEHR